MCVTFKDSVEVQYLFSLVQTIGRSFSPMCMKSVSLLCAFLFISEDKKWELAIVSDRPVLQE